MLAYTLLCRTDWQAITQDAEYLTKADSLLQSWLENQCVTWIEAQDARQYRSLVAQFTNTVLDIYFSVVAWENIARALRSD